MNFIKLVLGGGGVLGIIHVGVLDQIIKSNIKIHNIIGISAGSIVGAIYAYLLNNNDIEKSLYKLNEIIYNTDFSKFKDHNWINRVISLFSNNIHSFGIYKGDELYNWIYQKTDGCTFDEINFDLSIIATEMSGGYLTVFNKENTPNVKLADAVRASSSIQGIFKPHKIHWKDVANAIYINNSITSEKFEKFDVNALAYKDFVYFWDGGNLGNCRNDIALNRSPYSVSVLGVSLTIDDANELSAMNILNHTISIMMKSAEQLADEISNISDTPDVIIKPSRGSVSSMEFDITDSDKKNLIKSGKLSTEYGIDKLKLLISKDKI